jgi:hypothetical protein
MARPTARKQELLDLDSLMSIPAGRRFLWRLLTMSGVFRSSFSTDPLVMAMNEGQRNVGLRVVGAIMAVCPEKYIAMMRLGKGLRDQEDEDAHHVA